MPASALRAPRHPEIEPATLAEADSAWASLLWPDAAPAVRHSRRVAMLKRVLPAIGVMLLLLVAMWPRLAPLWERMRFALPAIDLKDARELRMVNPRYAGTDRQGHPFLVTSAAGRQVPDRQDLMSLEAPRAEMTTNRGTAIELTAATGIYQAQAQLLDLFGKVTLVRQDGTRFVTDRARIDITNNTAEGSDPVVGQGPSGDVKAEGFRILGKGEVILLTGKSAMRLRPASHAGKEAEPPALPAAVAAAALPSVTLHPQAAAAGPAAAPRRRSTVAHHPPPRPRHAAHRPR